MSLRDPNNNSVFQLFGGEPIKLRWGGWVSDTYILQREGWKFHAEEEYQPEYSAHRVRLAVTSPDGYVIIAGNLIIRRSDLLLGHPHHRDHMIDSLQYAYGSMFDRRPIEMQQFTSRDVFRYTEREDIDSWNNLTAVDVMSTTWANERQIYMGDFKFLKQISGTPETQIFIPEATVDDLFNQILKIQYPQQQEIKKGLIMPEKKQILQAQVFSLAA